jgi:hypothetical protein
MSGPFGSSQWMYNASTGGFYDFPITNSLRLDDTAYLIHTPPTAGNRRTWTFSTWIKGILLDANFRAIMEAYTGANDVYTSLAMANGVIKMTQDNGSGGVMTLASTALLRDPSAWYHLVVAMDTTQGTEANRVKLYLNGVQLALTGGYPSQNLDTHVNNTNGHRISSRWNAVNATNGTKAMLADTCLIDGSALTPSSFGETKNDIWIPKDTSDLTFGDEGWRLQYKQTGTGTASASTIGADTSGNNNHWTSNNLAASDVMPDSPTNNFAVQMLSDANGAGSVTEGGLKSQVTSSGNYYSVGTNIGMKGGKYYFEYRGIRGGNNSATLPAVRLYPDGTSSHSSASNPTGSINLNCGTEDGSDGVYMVALDLDNGKVYRGRNGSWSNSGDPTSGATGTGAVTTLTAANLTSHLRVGVLHRYDTGTSIITFNFGQESTFLAYTTAGGNADENGFGDFKYAPPSGYLAICTANLPDPVATIDPAQGGSPQDYFNTVLYTGNSASDRGITGVGFQPDWVWIKGRNTTLNHYLHDSVRGASQRVKSDDNTAETDQSASFKSFDTDGFTVTEVDSQQYNKNTQTYVAWNWKVGGSSSVNTDGTDIDSTGLFNTDLGMSIVTYTGTGSSGDSYGHGLDKAPELVLVKDRTDPANWAVFFTLTGVDGYLRLNDTHIKTTDTNIFPSVSATTIGVGTQGDGSIANTSGDSYVSYNFHSVDGYSKIGSYTGNSNADGPFIYTGFRPAWLLIKKTSATDDWAIHDNNLADYGVNSNPIDDYLKPNTNGSEFDDGASVDFLSNGFKWRINSGMRNQSGQTYSYMAFAEQPFKYANAR